MPKGGARSRSGPAPDPNALRRERDEGEWTILPAEGRSEPAPDWPLPDVLPRELDLWEQVWSLPQAVMWEKLRQEHFVALYVRRAVESEAQGAPVNLGTLVRQMAEELGITSSGMHRHRWKLEAGGEQTHNAEDDGDDFAGLRVVAS